MSNEAAIKDLTDRIQGVLQGRSLSRDILLEMGQIFLAEMQENFRVGGRPAPWKESARVRYSGGQTLLKSGALMRSLTVDIPDDSIVISSNKIYARIHALGGVIRAKNGEYLMFRAPAGMRSTDKHGRPLKQAKALHSWVRVKQVTMPRRDFTFISESGFNRAFGVIERQMKAGI
jgi:phage virion morphogenesis protein